MLLSGSEDGLNRYVFLVAIQIAKDVKFTLVPLILGVALCELDEGINNIARVDKTNSSRIRSLVSYKRSCERGS